MIIFDLDGTLADCSHRRHFVEINQALKNGYIPASDYLRDKITDDQRGHVYHKETGEKWKPDFKAFFEACDKDKLIQATYELYNVLSEYHEIEIWSGRCESVRNKTEKWLYDNNFYTGQKLKMRPIGDYTPDEQLKERWLDEHIASGGKPIEFIFDDRPKVVRMWRRRGIFVFDCNQSGEEF